MRLVRWWCAQLAVSPECATSVARLEALACASRASAACRRRSPTRRGDGSGHGPAALGQRAAADHARWRDGGRVWRGRRQLPPVPSRLMNSSAKKAQAITREENPGLLTSGGAWAEFAEKDKGRLTPGMLADFAVLSQDVFQVPEGQIPGTRSPAHGDRRQDRVPGRRALKRRQEGKHPLPGTVWGLQSVAEPRPSYFSRAVQFRITPNSRGGWSAVAWGKYTRRPSTDTSYVVPQ